MDYNRIADLDNEELIRIAKKLNIKVDLPKAFKAKLCKTLATPTLISNVLLKDDITENSTALIAHTAQTAHAAEIAHAAHTVDINQNINENEKISEIYELLRDLKKEKHFDLMAAFRLHINTNFDVGIYLTCAIISLFGFIMYDFIVRCTEI